MIHIVAVVVLVACFAIGTFSTLNIGALALVAALVVGTTVGGESVPDVLAGFPVDLFLLIFGVTYLFGLATCNGTMDYLLHRLAGRLGGRRHLVPPTLFVVTLAAVSIGAALPAVSAVIGGLALRLSRTLGVPVVLSALMVMFGGIGGTFSPITLGGVIVHSTLARGGLAVSQVGLYLITLAASVVLAAAAFALHGRHLVGDRAPVTVASAAGSAGDTEVGSAAGDVVCLTAPRVATILGIVALAVGLLGFRLEVGMLGATIAVALHLAFPRANRDALDGVNWSVLLLLCGIVTYVGLLERGGTIESFGRSMTALGSPLLAVFVVCLVVAALSAVASSAALLAAGILLITPFLESGAVAPLGVVAALAISATAVDVSPVSSASALLLAGAPPEVQGRLYRDLLRWSMSMVVVAPALSVGLLVLTGI